MTTNYFEELELFYDHETDVCKIVVGANTYERVLDKTESYALSTTPSNGIGTCSINAHPYSIGRLVYNDFFTNVFRMEYKENGWVAELHTKDMYESCGNEDCSNSHYVLKGEECNSLIH